MVIGSSLNTMKNNKSATGTVQSGETKNLTVSNILRSNKYPVDRLVNAAIVGPRCASTPPRTCSSSQESLTGSVTSVRRKVSAPAPKVPSTPLSTKSRGDSAPPPIRTISNIQGSKPGSLGRKTYKLNSQSNMRRAMSKDRVDISSNKEKENVKQGGKRDQSKANNCLTIIQLEKEKAMMEQQISELVRNAESKKAEIATLRMEINKLKNLQSDDAVEQLKQELDSLQLENQSLKERLVQLGAPLESAALSDSQKEQLLLQSRNSMQKMTESQVNLTDAPKSLETEAGEASGLGGAQRSLSDWDKASSSSMSEMSVACLQDRIMQMEETHHSTNEELQATLQELTDLQDQLSDLQVENERMTEEKAVLLESLCSQTEKLEECRSQITQLKQLLFQQHENSDQEPTLNSSEREKHLVELLKKAQEANDLLLMKQEELSAALEAAEKDSGGCQTDMLLLRDRVRLLESTVESVNADKRLLESQYYEKQEKLSANEIEISQLKLQLENEQQKVLELQKEQQAGATSELNALLQETRKDKEKIEEKAMRLQEQLAHSQHEVNRYKDQLSQLQEEIMVAKNNAHKQVTDLEFKVEQLEAEKSQINQEVSLLTEALQQSEVKCQHHLEDKRELKATVGELQKVVNEKASQMKEMQKEMEELKKKHSAEVEEWNRFQSDLLTTVRIANDFKTEAQLDVDRLMVENKQLLQKISNLETEIENLKTKQETLSSSSPMRTNIPFTDTDVPVLSNVEKDIKDISVAARRQLTSSKVRDRGANQLSVKSLIESIENATKQAKGQGPTSSCSSSTSSLNSVASDSRSNSLLFANSDVFMKPPMRADGTSLLRESKANAQTARLPRNSSIDGVGYSLSHAAALSHDSGSPSHGKNEVDGMKPLSPHPVHPVSILANKLDPMRRNSYVDLAEKKDPLAALIKGGGSKRNALLKWCQNKTMGYKGIDITNFSSSWNDGLAFCALLHSYLPDLIPYDELDCKDKRRNFTLAFQAAESVGISTTLNINDLISQERPDWQSIMTYVTSIYRHFET